MPGNGVRNPAGVFHLQMLDIQILRKYGEPRHVGRYCGVCNFFALKWGCLLVSIFEKGTHIVALLFGRKLA